jgi:hypothetical protein
MNSEMRDVYTFLVRITEGIFRLGIYRRWIILKWDGGKMI